MNNPTVRELVQMWMHIEPRNPAPSILVTDKVAATARGNFLGEDTSDPDAQGIAIYQDAQNLPTAIASILNHSQARANFHPANTSPEKLAEAFNGYVAEIDNNPFFHLLTNEANREVFNSSDYNLLIDQVVNLYKGVSSGDLDQIKTSITDMAKSVFGQESAEQWKNLFSQSTLDLSDPHNPTLYIYYTSLHMYHQKSGKSEVNEQDYEVHRTQYVILPDLIKAHAVTLAKLDKKSVDDWMDDSTSPERPNAELCFKVRPFRAPR